jgi:integrase
MDGLRASVHYPQGHTDQTTLHQPHIRHAHCQIGVTRIRFHDLRHSCATLLFVQGGDHQTIKDLLGHSSIGVTSAIYVDVLREVQRDAVDRLSHLFDPDNGTDTAT